MSVTCTYIVYACIVYVGPAAIMVGRVPLIPLFLAGNSTPTIPHKYSKHKNSQQAAVTLQMQMES